MPESVARQVAKSTKGTGKTPKRERPEKASSLPRTMKIDARAWFDIRKLSETLCGASWARPADMEAYRSNAERDFLTGTVLPALKAGIIETWAYELVEFELGRLSWTPDFLVMLADGSLEFWEVKGHMFKQDDVRIRAVISTFGGCFRFKIFYRVKNGWRVDTMEG